MSGDRGIAVVTGAAGGIGAPTLARLAADGWRLHLIDLEEGPLREAAAEYPGASWTASRLESPEACAAALPEGPIGAIVHLAGIFVEHPLGPEGREVYDRTLAANATNAFDLIGAAEDRLTEGARIVFISSLALTRGSPDHVAYSMAKGALVGLTRSLALRLAPRGILVNALAPGIIDTAMPAERIAKHGDALKERVPLKRFGKPEEVAGPIRFLLSEDAGYITGQTIAIDGGMVNL
ncbi:MAG: SDR family NAD(P)-dependent oxidoreductase [Pseudomonadota bacterium]